MTRSVLFEVDELPRVLVEHCIHPKFDACGLSWCRVSLGALRFGMVAQTSPTLGQKFCPERRSG
jgi:hypothetical protein